MEILVEMITTQIVKIDPRKLTHDNYWDVIKAETIKQHGYCDEIMFDWQSFENQSRPTPLAPDTATPADPQCPVCGDIYRQCACDY